MADQFTVTAVSAQEDAECNVFMLGLSEKSEDGDDGSYIIFQIPLNNEPTEQDREAGIDSYCIVSHHGGTCYGGLESVEVSGDTLSVRLTQKAADELGYQGPEVKMTLELVEAEKERLTAGLKQVLRYGDSKQQPSTTGL